MIAEQDLIQALTDYISKKAENEFSQSKCAVYKDFYLTDKQTDHDKIQQIWESFFEIVKKDSITYNQICNNFQTYYLNGIIDLDGNNEVIEITTYESFLKCLLKETDSIKYTDVFFDGNFKRMIGDCLREINLRAFRAFGYKIDDMNSKLREAQNERNDAAHPGEHDYRKLLKSYIKAYFVSTIIYDRIKENGARYRIISNAKFTNYVVTINNEVIFKSKMPREDSSEFIFINKKFFDSKNEAFMNIIASAPDYLTKTFKERIERGVFSTPSENDAGTIILQLDNTTIGTSVDIIGIVHIKNTKTEAQCYLRINQGVNTYGTDPDNGNHHQIRLGLRGIDIKPKHFEIGQKNDRIFIRDLSNGGTLVNEQPIDPKGTYVTENTAVRVADYLEIHISKI